MDICHHLLRDIVEDKDIDIQYIWSEDNPAYIMTINTQKADFVKAHLKRITEGELWKIVYTGRDNINNTRVTDVIIRDKTEYSNHAHLWKSWMEKT